MKYTGRFVSISLILLVHSFYTIYYFLRDNYIDILDVLGYPLLFCIAYWAGMQYDKAKFYSEKDVLTNLYNRRFVLSIYRKTTLLADQTNRKLFMLVIDCDNFKDINDSYGHSKGDLVLSKIGETLLQSSRKGDIIARWGGDEFLIIGFFKDELDLQNVHQGIVDDMEKLSELLDIPVYVSIGSTIYPDNSKDLDELIKSADHNMYEQKGQRKNR